MAETIDTIDTSRGGPTMVTPDGSRLVARRPGRELFPSSWLRRSAEVTYAGGSAKGTLLEFCGMGLVVQSSGSKVLIAWDCLQVVELIND